MNDYQLCILCCYDKQKKGYLNQVEIIHKWLLWAVSLSEQHIILNKGLNSQNDEHLQCPK